MVVPCARNRRLILLIPLDLDGEIIRAAECVRNLSVTAHYTLTMISHVNHVPQVDFTI